MSDRYSVSWTISECFESGGLCNAEYVIFHNDVLSSPECPLFKKYLKPGKQPYNYVVNN